jgi:hypothetical protein
MSCPRLLPRLEVCHGRHSCMQACTEAAGAGEDSLLRWTLATHLADRCMGDDRHRGINAIGRIDRGCPDTTIAHACAQAFELINAWLILCTERTCSVSAQTVSAVHMGVITVLSHIN